MYIYIYIYIVYICICIYGPSSPSPETQRTLPGTLGIPKLNSQGVLGIPKRDFQGHLAPAIQYVLPGTRHPQLAIPKLNFQGGFTRMSRCKKTERETARIASRYTSGSKSWQLLTGD